MPGQELLKELGVAPILLGILLMFWKGDDALADEFRADVSAWLGGLGDVAGKLLWPAIVHQQFMRLFGPRHFSIRCFVFSTLASMIAYALISLGFVIGNGVKASLFVWGAMIAIVINIIADYISLLETRWILEKIISGKINFIVGFILDFVLTIAIFITVYYFIYQLSFYITEYIIFYDDVLDYFNLRGYVLEKSQLFGGEIAHIGFLTYTFFLTTFVTSIWIWAAGFGGWVVRMTPGLIYALPVGSKPVRSIGVAVAIVVTIISFLIWMVTTLVG